jgi:hypothetical protein
MTRSFRNKQKEFVNNTFLFLNSAWKNTVHVVFGFESHENDNLNRFYNQLRLVYISGNLFSFKIMT